MGDLRPYRPTFVGSVLALLAFAMLVAIDSGPVGTLIALAASGALIAGTAQRPD